MQPDGMQHLLDYLHALARAYAGGQGTEHSGRTALENLLNALKPADAQVLHEPGRQSDKGAPDFKITRAGRVLGYVETKLPETDLRKVARSRQLKRYMELSDNILLTNYLDWIWLRNGEQAAHVRLAWPDDLRPGHVRMDEERAKRLLDVLAGFFAVQPEMIGDPDELAERLAVRARLLRDALAQELWRQQKEDARDRLFGLFKTFREQVFAELSTREFANAFAQTLAYALFLARLNAEEGEIIDLYNVKRFIPKSFSLIRELSDFLDDLEGEQYAAVRWVIDEILSIINALDMVAFHEALSFVGCKGRRGVRAWEEEEASLFKRDPYFYFYEYFLHRYDPKERETRGVYYTPLPVVNFITRAIDDILKHDFSLPDGLATKDHVTLLDFACGTGTFLLGVMERILDNIGGPDAGITENILREHILKNLYGFEFLIAPYTVAHLKLSQYLAEHGLLLRANERLHIYLTNTLEPIRQQQDMSFLPQLAKEVEQAQEVKEKPILVITGNPPYSGHSLNKGAWITSLLEDYKQVDGQPLGEKNPKWLNDDYVKFIRFAQAKMDGLERENPRESLQGVERGIVGVITNHSWLDNPTFRGMRRSLMNSFDAIYILDLHGNAKKRERAPDGSVDQNVFDIQQGVAISIFVKNPDLPDERKGIFHADLWGRRLDKYRALVELDVENTPFTRLEPVAPFYLFVPQDRSAWAEYEKGWPVTEIFPVHSVGIVTARDRLAIQFKRDRMWEVVRDFAQLEPEEARRKYRLGNDVQDWKVAWAQQDVKESGPREDFVQPILYRPFDVRYTYYTGRSRGFICRPREEVMRHMLRENVGLLTSRMTKGEDFAHVQITDKPSEVICMSPKTSNNGFLFSLYLYPDPDSNEHVENISPEFREWLDERLGRHVPPEEIMAYVYAVLHCPTYRQRYNEFLRIDFPRIPFPESLQDFRRLASLGQELMDVHLMNTLPDTGLARYDYAGADRADGRVQKPRFDAEQQRLWINSTTFFAPVPEEVWNFHIGGYQVLNKYLKDRKDRQLSLDEITQVRRIAEALRFTIDLMQAIDAAWHDIFG